MSVEITRDTREFTWSKVDVRRGNEDFGDDKMLELTYFGANLVGNRIYVFDTNLAFYYDLIATVWVSLEGYSPSLSENSTVVVDDRIMVCAHSEEHQMNGLLTYDLNLSEWSVRSVDFPVNPLPKRMVCEYVDFARMLVTFGGYNRRETNNTLVRINVDSLEVTIPRASGAPPQPRNGHASCSVVNSQEATIFIYGGENGNQLRNDLYMLHFEQNRFRWSQGAANRGCEPCCSASLNYIAGKLILYGGFDERYQDTDALYFYELDTKQWHLVQPTAPGGEYHRSGEYCVVGQPEKSATHHVFQCSGGLMVVGGFGNIFPWLRTLRATATT